MLCQGQCVEAAEVGCGTTTTDDDNGIKRGLMFEVGGQRVDAVQCGDDALFHLFALHNSREEGDVEMQAVGIVFQLSDEIAIAGSTVSRDDGDVLTEYRQWQLPLQVEDAFFLQLADNLLPLAGISPRV